MAGRRVALIISAGSFDHDGLNALPATATDTDRLKDVLASPDIGDYEVEFLQDTGVQKTRVAIDRFFADARADDLLVLYYAGHGLKDSNGSLHLAAADTDPDLLASTAIQSTIIDRAMSDSRAPRIVLILDCCYSGAFRAGRTARAAPRADVIDQFTGRVRVVITSSNAIEYAFEGSSGPDPTGDGPQVSVFTSVLVDGLATGGADLNRDGLIDVDELYRYVFDGVRRLSTSQTPQKFDNSEGSIVFAKAPGHVVAPPELAEATVTAVGTITATASTTSPMETAVDWAADAPARVDLLNRASLADVLASRLREVRRSDPAASFLLHVDGAWGTGKSSLLNFLDERLAGEFTIVRFDGWRQARLSPPWWALLSATRRGVTEGRGLFGRAWLRVRETFARAKRSGAPYLLAVILLLVVLGTVALLVPLTSVATTVTASAVALGTLWAGMRVASRFLLWDSARGAREASPAARELLAADAARALAAPQTRARTEHALRKFLPLLHSNPRNVKKFLNTYSVLRSVRVLENNTVSSDVLALWTIVRVRWPAMADHLERDPESVRGIVEPLWAQECFPPALQPLAADPDLREVVRCRDGGPLSAEAIRQCAGTAD